MIGAVLMKLLQRLVSLPVAIGRFVRGYGATAGLLLCGAARLAAFRAVKASWRAAPLSHECWRVYYQTARGCLLKFC